VTLEADGTTRAPQNCLVGVGDAFTLGYGKSVRLGPFRCTSRRIGMRCVVMRSGHGFVISRARLKRF
jgi:Family of unknown function (DUF6636)